MVRGADEQTRLILSENLIKIKKKYKPQKILLFGSRARGDNLKTSDFDILVVSEKFENVNWRKRIIDVIELWDNDLPLEPICLTFKEFELRKNELSIVGQAFKEGIEI